MQLEMQLGMPVLFINASFICRILTKVFLAFYSVEFQFNLTQNNLKPMIFSLNIAVILFLENVQSNVMYMAPFTFSP